jgi:hypothetical protein
MGMRKALATRWALIICPRTARFDGSDCPRRLDPSNYKSRLMSTLTDEIARRRTFAIISHPDAGKTTLTEKLLLFGGAIQLAGEVKARGERRRARSDWMAVERERGISVSSAVMSFEHEGLAFNLLDTPGHQDFSPLGFQRGHVPVPAER